MLDVHVNTFNILSP